MQECIYNHQRIQLSNNGILGVRLTWLDCKIAKKMTLSVSKDAVSKMELNSCVHCCVSTEGGRCKPRLRYFQSQSNSLGPVKAAHSFACNH